MTASVEGTKQHGEELVRHDERLKVVEAGVANFRTFQKDVRDFISRYDEREETREEARKRAEARKGRLHAALYTFLAGSGTAIVTYVINHWKK